MSGARQKWGELTKGEYVRSPWKQSCVKERGHCSEGVDRLDPTLHQSGGEAAQWVWPFVTSGEEWRPEASKEAQTIDSVEKSATGPRATRAGQPRATLSLLCLRLGRCEQSQPTSTTENGWQLCRH